jgi:hypothetical protein
LAADKAYASLTFRIELLKRGIQAAIPTFERCKRNQPKRSRPIKAGEIVPISLESRAGICLDGQLPEVGRALGAFVAYLQSFLFDRLDLMVGQPNFKMTSK